MSDEPPEQVLPELSPPVGFAGGWVPWTIVLDRSADIYALLQDFEAFPSGVRFSLRTRFRPGVFDPLGTFPGAPGGPEIAVTFADGRTARVEPPHMWDPQPGDITFQYHRGSGGQDEWTMTLWLSPLPPLGPLTFNIGWPEKGAPVRAATVEAAELIKAARETQRLW
jgi:hypothetical protein